MDAIPLSNPEWASSSFRALKNALWKKATTWADHVVTISEFSKSEIVKHFDIDAGRISVVPLGVDVRFFSPLMENEMNGVLSKYQLPENYFLFIGTLQPRKNLARVIDAHQSLPVSVRREYPLVIVGRAGWGCDDLVLRLKSMPENEPIHWLGGVDDMAKRALLQRAKALVFASLSEGFGLPVLEAFASSTPVIASNATSLPEVVGDAALLVDPLRVDDIANAMLRITGDSSLADQLKWRGLSRSRSFTWDACADKTRAIYRQMV
jgi:alpha-1,3-rhamnosyl/mannosyltransferase